ncbi:MAG: 4'-phosphopantetheinyl transferase superfamily protein [Erysipelotrichaceae bacterium]|jgi:holo-[acyl-carrier protein] synthase|nr:4'-phosphopantetheinyl transferase superfamily protein [Erysipelotrichaceae bacterium]
MIGIDVVEIDRVTLTDAFIQLILTRSEQKELLLRHTEKAKKEYIAGRFAVKEAIYKATQDQDYLHYSCLNQKNGKPSIEGHPEISVSISHDGGIAIAAVELPAVPSDHAS